MAWIILMLISFLVFYVITFKSRLECKTRTSMTEYWYTASWQPCDGRKLIPNWKLIVFPFLCLLPVINILFVFGYISWYMQQYNGPVYNDGAELIAYRWVLDIPLLNWLKKNREI